MIWIDAADTATASTNSSQPRPLLQPPRARAPATATAAAAAAAAAAPASGDNASIPPAANAVAQLAPPATLAGQFARISAIPDFANHAVGLTGGDSTHKADQQSNLDSSAISDTAAAAPSAAVPVGTQMQPERDTNKNSSLHAPGQILLGAPVSHTAAGELGMSHQGQDRQLANASPASQPPLLPQTQQVTQSPEAIARMQQQAILESSRHLIGVLTPDSPSSSSQHSGDGIGNPAHVTQAGTAGAAALMTASQHKKRKAPDAAGKKLVALLTSSPCPLHNDPSQTKVGGVLTHHSYAHMMPLVAMPASFQSQVTFSGDALFASKASGLLM